MRKLNPEYLTKLVKMVKDMCPTALEDGEHNKLFIRVDRLQKTIFVKLEKSTEMYLEKMREEEEWKKLN